MREGGGCKLEKGQRQRDDDRERVCRIRLFPRNVGETGFRAAGERCRLVYLSPFRDDQRYVIVTLIGGRTVKMATDDGGSTTIVDERVRKSPNLCKYDSW